MAHSPILDAFRNLSRLSRLAASKDVSLSTAREMQAEADAQRLSRRQVLGGLGVTAAAATVAAMTGTARAKPVRGQPRIAIVGAGLAGLVCADQLRRQGLSATVYEAHPNRVGGRCFSDRTTFAGQVSENGGEFIDNGHKTMLAYAREFNLVREDLLRAPGESRYRFFGGFHSEEDVVAEYRVLVERMRPDLQALGGGPTFFVHSDAEVGLDNTDLGTYLATRAADLPLIRAVLSQAYTSEYGLEVDQQSCLNLLQFIHLDRRSHFAEFGVFSNERWHVVGGNDGITTALANRLGGAVHRGASLTRLGRNGLGEYELYFSGSATPERADAVVCALPFSVLRRLTLDASLGLSADKLRAINDLGYGTNVKTTVQFNRRVWAEQGANGHAYADLANVQNTWETNYSAAGVGGLLTDYGSGDRGVELQLNSAGTMSCGGCHTGAPTNAILSPTGRDWIQAQMAAFVGDADRVFPGAAAAVSRRFDGSIVGQRAHWLPQPFSRGSYTCYKPGQFTGIAGLEPQAAGALKFAGEHTDSFYEWQGFMEGAALSGIQVAADVIARVVKR